MFKSFDVNFKKIKREHFFKEKRYNKFIKNSPWHLGTKT